MSERRRNPEFASRFLNEVCDFLGETFVLGAAFHVRYRMILHEEPRLLRRYRWRGILGRTLDLSLSSALIVIGVNVALLRGPWLVRRYGIRTDVTPLQYLTILAVFGAPPYFLLVLAWPRFWWFPLLACGLNYLLARFQTEVSSVAQTDWGLLVKLWTSAPGNATYAVVAPGLVSYYTYMRLVGTVAWMAGQRRFATACIEELSSILDHSETFDLAEDCLAVATERTVRKGSKGFGATRLAIRTASLRVTAGRLKEAEGILKAISPFQVKDDETRRWSAFRDLTEARLHQEGFAFERALRCLENARLTLRLRLSGPRHQDKKTKAHLAQLFAHTAEQKILTFSVLSRFDEACESARTDAKIVADYGDSLRTMYFDALAAFMQTLAGTRSSSAELTEFEQRLTRAEQELHQALNQDMAESDNLVAGHTTATTGDSSNSVLRLFSQNHRLLFVAVRTLEFQRAAIVAAALFARCRWEEGSLRCLDKLDRIKLDNAVMKLNAMATLRAVALALGGKHNQAVETILNAPRTEMLPIFDAVARAVLHSAIEWDGGRLHSAVMALQGVAEQVLDIGFHYAAIDVRAALVLINEHLLVNSADVTLFLCLLGPVLFLWNVGMGLMRFEQGNYNDGTPRILGGLEWLEDRRVFIETSLSIVGFKSRYGWLYDLAIVSLLDQKRYADALRLSERLRCMTLLVMNHYQALDLEEVHNWVLWKNYRRIRNHIRELLDIAERRKGSHDGDGWFDFLRRHFADWTPATAEAELLRLASELDHAAANLRREHPKFRQLQAGLLLQRDPIPVLEEERAILYYLFDSMGRLWVVVVRSSQRVNCVLALASRDELAEWVPDYVKKLKDVSLAWEDIRVKGELLGRILVEPVGRYLQGITEICIVPHGPLFDLPFHALVLDQRYAVCLWSFSYLPALSFLWLAPSSAELSRPRALAVIDPDTDEFYRLKNSSVELDVLYKHFEVEVQRGAKATKSAFSQAAGHFPFIHVAAHAEADDKQGRAAYVRFAGGLDSDCRLRPRDIVALHLNCFLCNLSSCQSGTLCVTSLGEIEGLATSFLVAGTRHIIAALWEVRDLFAPELMDRFYSGPFLEQPALALSLAQRHWAQRHSSVDSEQFAHPNFWAPFYAVERFDFGSSLSVQAK